MILTPSHFAIAVTMAFRNTSPGNEMITNSGFGDTLKTLLRVGGGWGTVR